MIKNGLILLLLLPFFVQGQGPFKAPPPAFYVYDSNWKAVPVERAVYLLVENQESDSCWRLDYYHFYGPLIKTERYTSKAADVQNGAFVFYNTKGTIDSNHHYRNGLAANSWFYFDHEGKVYLQKRFVNGHLVRTIDRQHPDLTDDPTGGVSLYPDDERESEFKGGVAGWRKYLLKNHQYPKRGLDLKIEGVVIVQFMVDEAGNVRSPSIAQSVEYSYDTEALRIIQTSPRWTPGTLGGGTIKTYKRQPVTFRLK